MKTARPRTEIQRRTSRSASWSRAGFTLVELIAAITITAFVAVITTSVLWTAVNATARGGIQADLQTTISTAAEQVVRHMRNIPKQPNKAAPDIAYLKPTAIVWSTDTSLSLSGTNLVITVAGGTPRVLLRDVQEFEIRAFDESNNELARNLTNIQCESVRRISIRIVASRGDGAGTTELVRTKVFIRSMLSGT